MENQDYFIAEILIEAAELLTSVDTDEISCAIELLEECYDYESDTYLEILDEASSGIKAKNIAKARETLTSYHNWLKKHDFQPNEGSKTKGTIDIDGKRYDVDTQIHKSTYNLNNKHINIDMPRQTCATLYCQKDGSQPIILDKVFAQLSDKDREYVIRHEANHQELHSMDSDSKHLRKDVASKAVPRAVQSSARGLLIKNPGEEAIKIAKRTSNKVHKDFIKDQDNQRKENKKSGNDDLQKKRDLNFKNFQKYRAHNNHTNETEFEADIAAAESLGDKNGKEMMTAIKHASTLGRLQQIKKNTKNPLLANKLVANWRLDPDVKEDVKNRQKALKDKNINHEPYKKKSQNKTQNECIAELLIEAAELLKD